MEYFPAQGNRGAVEAGVEGGLGDGVQRNRVDDIAGHVVALDHQVVSLDGRHSGSDVLLGRRVALLGGRIPMLAGCLFGQQRLSR